MKEKFTSIEQAEKAYGGCHNCWGKGYTTVSTFTVGYPDFHDDEGFEETTDPMNFCECGRGKQG